MTTSCVQVSILLKFQTLASALDVSSVWFLRGITLGLDSSTLLTKNLAAEQWGSEKEAQGCQGRRLGPGFRGWSGNVHPCISMHAHLHQAEVLQLLIASQHGYPFDLFPWVQRTCNRGMRQFFRRCSGVVFRFYSTCYEGNILNDEEFSTKKKTHHIPWKDAIQKGHISSLSVLLASVWKETSSNRLRWERPGVGEMATSQSEG